jgi:hypothetical protein
MARPTDEARIFGGLLLGFGDRPHSKQAHFSIFPPRFKMSVPPHLY